MLKNALEYLDIGIVPLPCMGEGDSKGKVPLVKWRDIQELPTKDQVKEWFTKFPNANIGFKTGKVSGILVLDNDGVEITEELPITPIATSRPGHYHYYFKNPDFYIPPSTSKVGEHLDIRCDQGFIVAPPSKHFDKKTGKEDGQYTWIKGASPFDVPLAKPPQWLLMAIKAENRKTYGFDWTTALNINQGARDDTLKSAASSLVAKGFDKENALAILRGINATYSPPLADNVVVNKLETAIKFIGEQKNSFLIGKPYAWDKIPEEDNKKEWVWENYVAKGNITLLSALWKAGKSTFLRHLFVAISKEEEFAGQPTKKAKILVVSEEDHGEWIDQREGLIPENINHILVWSRPIRMKPNLKQWIELIENLTEKCKEEKIDMVVIDTLTTFWPIDNENDPAQVIKALVPLYNFTENRIAVFLVHHFRKSGGDQAQASRGSGALPGFVDNIIEFTRHIDDGANTTKRILKTYGRFDNVIPEIVIDLTADGKYKTLGDPYEVSKSARIHKIINMFKEGFEKLSVKDIQKMWISSGGTISLRSVQNYTKDLIQKDILSLVDTQVSDKGAKTPIYTLTEHWQDQTQKFYPLANGACVSSGGTYETQALIGKEPKIFVSSTIGQEKLPDIEEMDPRV